jgi:Family of unknown function (DUF6510)
MPTMTPDLDRELMLDANAVAGTLEQIFGRDVTASLIVCNECGNTAALGTLKAFTHAPGVVLRCSICEQVVLRFATTPQGVSLDLRGLSCIRFSYDA